jgi:hypothetical protein
MIPQNGWGERNINANYPRIFFTTKFNSQNQAVHPEPPRVVGEYKNLITQEFQNIFFII